MLPHAASLASRQVAVTGKSDAAILQQTPEKLPQALSHEPGNVSTPVARGGGQITAPASRLRPLSPVGSCNLLLPSPSTAA